jgi:hypothetical protein
MERLFFTDRYHRTDFPVEMTDVSGSQQTNRNTLSFVRRRLLLFGTVIR